MSLQKGGDAFDASPPFARVILSDASRAIDLRCRSDLGDCSAVGAAYRALRSLCFFLHRQSLLFELSHFEYT